MGASGRARLGGSKGEPLKDTTRRLEEIKNLAEGKRSKGFSRSVRESADAPRGEGGTNYAGHSKAIDQFVQWTTEREVAGKDLLGKKTEGEALGLRQGLRVGSKELPKEFKSSRRPIKSLRHTLSSFLEGLWSFFRNWSRRPAYPFLFTPFAFLGEPGETSIFQQSLSELKLSPHVHRALRDIGMEVIGDVVGMTERSLLRFSEINKNEKAINEIKQALGRKGLWLGMNKETYGKDPWELPLDDLRSSDLSEEIIQQIKIRTDVHSIQGLLVLAIREAQKTPHVDPAHAFEKTLIQNYGFSQEAAEKIQLALGIKMTLVLFAILPPHSWNMPYRTQLRESEVLKQADQRISLSNLAEAGASAKVLQWGLLFSLLKKGLLNELNSSEDYEILPEFRRAPEKDTILDIHRDSSDFQIAQKKNPLIKTRWQFLEAKNLLEEIEIKESQDYSDPITQNIVSFLAAQVALDGVEFIAGILRMPSRDLLKAIYDHANDQKTRTKIRALAVLNFLDKGPAFPVIDKDLPHGRRIGINFRNFLSAVNAVDHFTGMESIPDIIEIILNIADPKTSSLIIEMIWDLQG